MNQTQIPSLNDAVTGFVFQSSEPTTNVDHKALEISCIDLICKLENCLAKAREMDKDDFIDESSEIANNILEQLSGFSGEFLTGSAAEQAKSENEKAKTVTHTYDAVLKTRPFTNALLRTFWDVPESADIQSSHSQLGEALVRACAVTFYHTVMLVGLDSEFGKEIDQSTVVFVNELKQSWS